MAFRAKVKRVESRNTYSPTTVIFYRMRGNIALRYTYTLQRPPVAHFLIIITNCTFCAPVVK